MSPCYHCQTPVGPEETRCPNCGIKLRNTRAENYKILAGVLFIEIFILGVCGGFADALQSINVRDPQTRFRLILPGTAVLITLGLVACSSGWKYWKRSKARRAERGNEVEK